MSGGESLSTGRRWLIGAALIACAGLLSAITPSDEDVTGPFIVRGGADATASSHQLSAQVLSASFADRILADGGDWEADGNWLVVELKASATRTEVGTQIMLATLHVDGLVFRASERVPETLRSTRLHLGTDTVGYLAFELADGIRSGECELRLTAENRTPRLDDVLSLRVSLDEASRTATFELPEPEVGAP